MTSILFTRVPIAQLRAWAPFVRKDALRAGDIVLSRGRGWQSCAIALMTGGRYSHSAIFLPFRIDDFVEFGGVKVPLKGVHLDLVEADDYDVGAVPPRPLTIAVGGDRYDVVRLPGERGPKAAVLLRHPDIKSVDERTLEQAVLAFNDIELLRTYSSMDRLAGPLPLPGPIKRAVGRILSAAFPEPKGPVLPGCFCSELVVKFFERLGIPLFAKAAAPENISPNRLLPPRSLLQIVPDAIVTAADLPDDAAGEALDILRRDMRFRHLPGLVKVTAAQKLLLPEVRKKIEDEAEACTTLKDALAGADDLSRDTQATIVQEQILHALSDRSIAPSRRRALNRLLVRSVFLKVLRDHLRSEAMPDAAGSELRRLHDRANIELARDLTRTVTLVRMSLARRLPAEASRQVWMRALSDWRSQKALCAQARASLAGPGPGTSMPDGESGDDTGEWVRKVLDEVTAKATAALDAT
jgi:hypothetical protein